MRRLRGGIRLQEPFVLQNLQRKGIEHVVSRFSRQVLCERSVDDLFAPGTEDIDFDEGVSRFKSRCQRARIFYAHGAPEDNLAFFLRPGDQLRFGLCPGVRSGCQKKPQQDESTATRCLGSVTHVALSVSSRFRLNASE